MMSCIRFLFLVLFLMPGLAFGASSNVFSSAQDTVRLVSQSNAAVQGKVISKASEADFATQRDINGSPKRDIETVQLKLIIDNPGESFVPGMTADVFVPKSKLVKQ